MNPKNHLQALKIIKVERSKGHIQEFKTFTSQPIIISTPMVEEDLVEILLNALLDFDESFTKVIVTHAPPYYLKCLWADYNMKKTKNLSVKKKVIKECFLYPLQDMHVPSID
jgi:Icc-related predicted phosphoesterase